MKDHLVHILVGLIGALVMGLAFGGWHLHAFVTNDLASKEEVVLAMAKADYVIDRQMEDLVRQIAYLEKLPNKTPGQLNQLNYLRKLLENMRKVRSGK